MCGYYFDRYTKSEFIIPATALVALSGCAIVSLTFYAPEVGINQWNSNQKVFVNEVAGTTLGGSNSVSDDATVAFDGQLPMLTLSADGY